MMDLQEMLEAIRSLRENMDRTEEGPEFENSHQLIDELGHLRRNEFPRSCEFRIGNDLSIQMDCDVYLSHDRFGFSVGCEVKESHCSVCGLDLHDCHHILGRTYDGIECILEVTQADIIEISIVARPAFSLARMTSMPISVTNDDRLMGQIAQCNICLKDCRGLRRPFG